MKNVKRFGVSLEEELLKILDEFVSSHGFPNRSQALRYLIRENLVQDEWQEDRQVAGCLVLVYDHHKNDLINNSVTIQHDYQECILANQHIHLDHDNCLETIAVKGRASKLQELADKLIALKGIKHGKLVMTTKG